MPVVTKHVPVKRLESLTLASPAGCLAPGNPDLGLARWLFSAWKP
jgi:hypothetical protein